jgi:hypothetical protein
MCTQSAHSVILFMVYSVKQLPDMYHTGHGWAAGSSTMLIAFWGQLCMQQRAFRSLAARQWSTVVLLAGFRCSMRGQRPTRV